MHQANLQTVYCLLKFQHRRVLYQVMERGLALQNPYVCLVCHILAESHHLRRGKREKESNQDVLIYTPTAYNILDYSIINPTQIFECV